MSEMTMVERVARALCRRCIERSHSEWPEFVDDARAAIAAMREPTEAMMAAVDCAGEKKDWPSGRAWISGWQAMIDEALR